MRILVASLNRLAPTLNYLLCTWVVSQTTRRPGGDTAGTLNLQICNTIQSQAQPLDHSKLLIKEILWSRGCSCLSWTSPKMNVLLRKWWKRMTNVTLNLEIYRYIKHMYSTFPAYTLFYVHSPVSGLNLHKFTTRSSLTFDLSWSPYSCCSSQDRRGLKSQQNLPMTHGIS